MRLSLRFRLYALLLLGVANAQEAGCPCLTEFPAALRNSDLYDQAGNCLKYSDADGVACYPLRYGLDICKPHDQNLEPFCTALFPPGFCDKDWCYVDKNNCDLPNYESSYFGGKGLYYSYEACGSVNSFVTFMNEGLPVAVSSLLKLVQSYSMAAKASVEENIALLDGVNASDSESCYMEEMCQGCSSCTANAVWGQNINVNGVNTMFHPSKPTYTTENRDEIRCLNPFFVSSYRRIASREYNDENRIAYQYMGFSKSGAIAQWPATDWCDPNFDPRKRPWFVATVSGQKAVVLVIDVSGSMAGTRISLARAAAKEVLATLAWTDKVGIIIFNSNVAGEFKSRLVDASTENLASMENWIDAHVVAAGGTEFAAPLDRAYDMLSRDSESVSKMILFLSDGEDTGFSQAHMNGRSEDVVIFSYGLGSGASAESLKIMACSSSGIYFPVLSEASLPSVMQSYFQYFIELVDYCNLAWIRYSDYITGEELISACSPIFDPRTSGTSLLGVNCIDLNVVVSSGELARALPGRYEAFVEALKGVSTFYDPPSKVTQTCLLAKLRQDAGSECASDPTPCTVKKASKECVEPSLNQFDGFILGADSQSSPRASPAAVAGIGVGVGVALLSILALFLHLHRQSVPASTSEGNNDTRLHPNNSTPGAVGQHEVPLAQVVPSGLNQEVEFAHEVPKVMA